MHVAISQVIAAYIILQWTIEFTVPLKTDAMNLQALNCAHNCTHVSTTGLFSRIVLLKHKSLQVQDLKLLIPPKPCTSAAKTQSWKHLLLSVQQLCLFLGLVPLKSRAVSAKLTTKHLSNCSKRVSLHPFRQGNRGSLAQEQLRLLSFLR